MGCYKVLSTPMLFVKKEYKGLNRVEAPYGLGTNKRYISLWERYIEYNEPLKNTGITNELTIDELKEYANLATQETGESYEVIYFSKHKDCLHKFEYYGVDVTGVGVYSMVGEGFFRGSSPVHNVLTQYFTEKLNAYGLFGAYEDAECFRAVIMQLGMWLPGSIEDEDWQILHIFKVL